MLEAGEFELVGHVVHSTEPAAEYVPAPQFEHVAVPAVSLYFPAPHGVHVPPLDPDEPALQVQAPIAELEAGEFELVGHPVHTLDTVAPTVAENLPVPQFVHEAVPVVSLYFPTAHVVH